METDYTQGFRGGSKYARRATVDRALNVIADEMQALKHNSTRDDALLAIARIRKGIFDLAAHDQEEQNGPE